MSEISMAYLKCVVCNSLHAKKPKVLPCLHICCQACLQDSLNDSKILMAIDSENSRSCGSIFSCPKCHYKVQIWQYGVSGLKSFSTKPSEYCMDIIQGNLDFHNQEDLNLEDDGSGDGSRDDTQFHVSLSNSSYCCEINRQTEGCAKENDHNLVSVDLLKEQPAGTMFDLSHDYFCSTCDMAVCSKCIDISHSDHTFDKLDIVLNAKRLYIENLSHQVKSKQDRHEKIALQIGNIEQCLEANKSEMEKSINSRAEHLVQMMMRRRNDMLKELEKEFNACKVYYACLKERLNEEIDLFEDSINFADAVVAKDQSYNLLNFHNDIITQLNRLVSHLEEAKPDVLSLRFNIPEAGKEESHLEKLFGLLVSGNINCGGAELLTTFHVDLTWPTSFIATSSKDFVVAGKTGAFESDGKVLFFDRHANIVSSYSLEKNHLPVDILSLPEEQFLLSNNKGSISKFMPDGRLLEVWENKFKGSSGHMALFGNGKILVTSSQEKCLYVYSTVDGKHLNTLKLYFGSTETLLDIHAISVDVDERIVVSVLEDKSIYVFSRSGCPMFSFPDYSKFSDLEIKCPSAICCDPFGNILVADFTNDCILLISRNGQFLGYLLTKTNGISCPNFVVLDHSGHLCVGQYGGEILVFRYLSCMKNV